MRNHKFFLLLFVLLAFNNIMSPAQEIWMKHSIPVLHRSSAYPDWKGLAAADASVIKDNDTFKMWFSGSGWIDSSDLCPRVRIGYAWSLDGITWSEYNDNPVFDINPDTSKFDSDGIETPTVIKDLSAPSHERYKMWYAGRKLMCVPINDHKFGYATSPDGIHWTRYSQNPVLIPGADSSWFNSFVSSPSVILDEGIYKMWFTAPDLILNGQPTDGKGNIGYATSNDGIDWSIYPNPVLIAGEQLNWDSASIAEPSVVKINNMYHMFYSALDQWGIENFQVGYAVSVDGIFWTKSTRNPVLQIGSNGQWDRYWASHPSVVYDNSDNKFKMWYTGRDTANIVSLAGYFWDIGFAESYFNTNVLPSIKWDNTIQCYPNPSQNKLVIELPIESAKFQIQVVLYN